MKKFILTCTLLFSSISLAQDYNVVVLDGFSYTRKNMLVFGNTLVTHGDLVHDIIKANAKEPPVVKQVDLASGGLYIIHNLLSTLDIDKRIVVNLSFTHESETECDPFLQVIIDKAISHGHVIVAAAGNHGQDTLYWPASCNGVQAIGAKLSNGVYTDYTNTNTKVLYFNEGPIKGTSFTTALATSYVFNYIKDHPKATNEEIGKHLLIKSKQNHHMKY